MEWVIKSPFAFGTNSKYWSPKHPKTKSIQNKSDFVLCQMLLKQSSTLSFSLQNSKQLSRRSKKLKSFRSCFLWWFLKRLIFCNLRKQISNPRRTFVTSLHLSSMLSDSLSFVKVWIQNVSLRITPWIWHFNKFCVSMSNSRKSFQKTLLCLMLWNLTTRWFYGLDTTTERDAI